MWEKSDFSHWSSILSIAFFSCIIARCSSSLEAGRTVHNLRRRNWRSRLRQSPSPWARARRSVSSLHRHRRRRCRQERRRRQRLSTQLVVLIGRYLWADPRAGPAEITPTCKNHSQSPTGNSNRRTCADITPIQITTPLFIFSRAVPARDFWTPTILQTNF